MNTFTRLALLPIAALLVSAAPAAQEIRVPGATPDWVLIVPVGSPVEFRGWHQYGYAEFDGRFVLTGKFALTLTENCERPGTEDCLVLDLEPDPAVAARLPYYRNQSGGWINIREEGRLVRSIASPRQRAALVAGKIQSLTGRTSIVVDQLSTGIDCESASFWARFVAIAKVPKLARTNFNGGFGCGH